MESREDRYCDIDEIVERLIREWKTYKRIVIAYDFDNTVFDYHKVGDTFPAVIKALQRAKKIGAYLIVSTCCEGEKEKIITDYLSKNDIPWDAINENAPFIPFQSRKIYYNILLDDRAGLGLALYALEKAMDEMEK